MDCQKFEQKSDCFQYNIQLPNLLYKSLLLDITNNSFNNVIFTYIQFNHWFIFQADQKNSPNKNSSNNNNAF